MIPYTIVWTNNFNSLFKLHTSSLKESKSYFPFFLIFEQFNVTFPAWADEVLSVRDFIEKNTI